jgi:mRNA-degrading endonuclease RelE of RelBE toxin-antitoxin system
MSWTVELTKEAERQLKRLPRTFRQQVERSIEAMEKDPFAGNVKALQGEEWEGIYRKRAGRYRIIFLPLHQERTVKVLAILLRSEKTYR